MDEELINLFEQHKVLVNEVKKQQATMLEIRRHISMKLTLGNYGILVIPFYSMWDNSRQH